MKLNCYNCNKVTTAASTSNPKCLACGSEAVQFIEQPKNQNVARQRTSLFSEALPVRRRVVSPFNDVFENMGGGFGNRTTGIDEMMQRMRNMMMRDIGGVSARMNRMPQMHSNDHDMEPRFNAPMFFQQQIISNPNGTFIYRSNSNNPGHEQWQHIQNYNNPQMHHQQYQIEEPVQQYKPRINDFPSLTSLSEQCSICHTHGSKGVILPCGHQFHDDCLKPWFEMKDTCPCCRHKLKPQHN